VNQFVNAQNLEIGGHTDAGRRDHNEDTFLIDRDIGLVIVADGVGGHQSGEVASRLTCEVLPREIAAGADLNKAIDKANTEVIEAVRTGEGKPGMGSTVVAVLMTEAGYELAWVGDSRVYLWDGKLSLLTRDHSLVEVQLASGQISMEEARNHPRKNVILQAVGLQQEDNLDIGSNAGRLAPGNCLLLCSDGITDPLDNEQLCQLLSGKTTAQETCRRMIDTALQCGGRDNATAVLIVNNGPPQATAQGSGPADVVWVYDPETGDVKGLPDVTMRANNHGVTSTQTQVQRVKPSTATPAVAMDDAGRKTDTGRRARKLKYFWLVALFGTLAMGLAYSLC
jgi:serine/threonine protein phosphatase PrpC